MAQIGRSILCAAAVVGWLAAAPAATIAGELSSFLIPWGERPNELGLVEGPEIERVGPLTFAVAPQGEIYVADTVHRQIKRWQSDGTYGGVVLNDVRPNAMNFDERGLLLLLTGRHVQIFTQSGQLLHELTLPPEVPLVEGYAQEVWMENERVCVNDPDETVYCFDTSQTVPTTASQILLGRRVDSTNRILVHRQLGDVRAVKLAAATAGATREALTKQLSATFFDAKAFRRRSDSAQGALLFRGYDERRKAYLFEMEEIQGRNVQLRVVSTKDGKLGGALDLPNAYYTTVYKKVEMARDGSLWQMLTTKEGVKFTHWEVQP